MLKIFFYYYYYLSLSLSVSLTHLLQYVLSWCNFFTWPIGVRSTHLMHNHFSSLSRQAKIVILPQISNVLNKIHLTFKILTRKNTLFVTLTLVMHGCIIRLEQTTCKCDVNVLLNATSQHMFHSQMYLISRRIYQNTIARTIYKFIVGMHSWPFLIHRRKFTNKIHN